MWEATSFKKTGIYHLENSLQCQDQFYHKAEGQYQAIVLADGTGKTDMNVPCVKEVVEYTADSLLRIMKDRGSLIGNKEMIIEEIMGGVVRIISKHMDLNDAPIDQFASTLLGMTIDSEKGEYLLVHIGDGIIIRKNEKDVKVLSHPVNKEANQTFLTISENLLECTKVKIGEIGNTEQFVMCTDGMYDFPLKREFTEKTIWEYVDEKRSLPDREDDQSFIQLRRI